MSFTITLGFLALCAFLLAGFILSLLGLAFVRFALNAKVWDGFMTFGGLLKACRIITTRKTASVYYCGDYYKLTRTIGGWVFHDSGSCSLEIKGGNVVTYWRMTDPCVRGRVTFFKSVEEALEAVESLDVRKKSEEEDINYNLLLVFDLLLVAFLADLAWWLFGLYPILTVSVCSTVALTLCTRWLSGKLATTVKQTKENTDDIKVLKDADKQ